MSRLLLAASSLACLASSEPARPIAARPPSSRGTTPGSLFITNQSGSVAIVRVRKLRDDVSLACNLVSGSPSSMLSRELFAPADLWRVEDGESLPLDDSLRACTAFLIDGDGLGQSIVFFLSGAYPSRLIAPGEGSGAEITLSRGAAGMTLSEHPALYPAPQDEIEADEACRLPGPEASIDWSTPFPSGTSELLSVTSSPDGCHALDVKGGRFYLCAPLPSLPCQPGDQVKISSVYTGLSGKVIDGVEVRCGEAVIRLARGGDLAPASQLDQVTTHKVSGCPALHAGCGEVALPLEVSVDESTLRAGEELPVGDHGRLLLVRAQQMLVVDQQCSPGPTAGYDRLESVFVDAPAPAQAP